MAEGETQYNIPVSSKQLIVYFVFLVIALTAAFLAGVMVGRNVDSSPEPMVRDIQDGLPEDFGASPTPDVLTYGSALQGDKIEGLSTVPQSATTSTPKASVSVPPPAAAAIRTEPNPEAAATRKPAPKSPSTSEPESPPKPASRESARPGATPLTRLTIQVGAFKARSAAEAIVKRLKGKGYSAYLVPVAAGLFNVRVGSFTDRESAERIMKKLEIQEKFKPFIVTP